MCFKLLLLVWLLKSKRIPLNVWWFELSWHKVPVEESVGRIFIFFFLLLPLINYFFINLNCFFGDYVVYYSFLFYFLVLFWFFKGLMNLGLALLSQFNLKNSYSSKNFKHRSNLSFAYKFNQEAILSFFLPQFFVKMYM